MKPNYSVFPNTHGTLKPNKSEYCNLPNIKELTEQHKGDPNYLLPDKFWTLTWQRALVDLPPESYYANDLCPIPATSDRELYWGENHFYYWWSGLFNWLTFKFLYEKYHGLLMKNDTFFELGCATGRVLRHALLQHPTLNIIGCDLNARHVDWCQQFLPERACIFQNHTLPSLPLEDRSIDIGIALSVFTHIDDQESGWLMELRRVLKPGALFFVTIMSNKYWRKLGSDQAYAGMKKLFLGLECEHRITDNSFIREMPEQRLVMKYPGDVYNTMVFHSTEYIYSVWNRYMEVMDIIEAGEGFQDIVVLRKR